MSEKRVQIIVRATQKEKDKIKQKAKDNDISMNQLIISSVINTGDSADDITGDSNDINNDSKPNGSVIEILKAQLDNKDKQIDKLHTLLDQQQQLSLSDKREKETLKIELQEVEKEKTEEEGMKTTSPWWKFWDNRK